jgi:hypothetical protein
MIGIDFLCEMDDLDRTEVLSAIVRRAFEGREFEGREDDLAEAYEAAQRDLLDDRRRRGDRERWHYVGPLYDRDRSPKQIAKLVKARVRQRWPEVVVGVTSDWGTAYRSVRCKIRSVPFEVYDEEGRLTPEAEELRAEIMKIGREYNYDLSDSVTDYCDVGFFWSVDFCGSLRTRWRETQPTEEADEVRWKAEGF